jgi:hypothetical protein
MSGYLFMDKLLPKSNSVSIEVDGRQTYILPATENRIVPVKGSHGYTYVEINDGKVRINSSPCTSKLCVQHGWITSGVLVCLPNRVVVTIGSHSEKNTPPDAITG